MSTGGHGVNDSALQSHLVLCEDTQVSSPGQVGQVLREMPTPSVQPGLSSLLSSSEPREMYTVRVVMVPSSRVTSCELSGMIQGHPRVRILRC